MKRMSEKQTDTKINCAYKDISSIITVVRKPADVVRTCFDGMFFEINYKVDLDYILPKLHDVAKMGIIIVGSIRYEELIVFCCIYNKYYQINSCVIDSRRLNLEYNRFVGLYKKAESFILKKPFFWLR